MELIIKALAEAPLVAIIAYIWWVSRRDATDEMRRLQARIREKDLQLGEFAKSFDRLSVLLELIKDRLR